MLNVQSIAYSYFVAPYDYPCGDTVFRFRGWKQLDIPASFGELGRLAKALLLNRLLYSGHFLLCPFGKQLGSIVDSVLPGRCESTEQSLGRSKRWSQIKRETLQRRLWKPRINDSLKEADGWWIVALSICGIMICKLL